MEIHVLGPLEVLDGERRLEISAPKQRLLLTVLALTPGQVVSAERLVDELWGDDPPAGGLKTFHYHVSKLRSALQPNRGPGDESVIATVGSGYMLALDPSRVDATRFEKEVLEACRLVSVDPAQVSNRLREALALWRGPIACDVWDTSVSSYDARRLEDLRLIALEQRITADLALGRHTEAVAELEALASQYPLRERMWGLLMVALYRTDRQAEALHAYRQLQVRLGELGIEPCRHLRRLEELILVQDPEVEMPEECVGAADILQPL